MARANSKRSVLLQVAGQLVRREGYSALTLEAVAAEAGVSKGGLLYHFPTKEALVAALVEALIDGFETGHQECLVQDSAAPGAWARAYLRASVAPEGQSEADGITAGLLAGVALDPNLLAPLRARYAAWVTALESDGLPGVNAHIVRLAADGIWLADLMELAPPSGVLRAQVLARLIELGGGSHEEA
ncbi:MAG: TetR/AcrR family transcriptional regulator [Armatimonadetes bacterium]|nr:TetR/AcrR family transcriptional regulator [Armatimonadota bacterium]